MGKPEEEKAELRKGKRLFQEPSHVRDRGRVDLKKRGGS